MAVIENIAGLKVTGCDRSPGTDLANSDGTPLEEWDPVQNSLIAGRGPSPSLHQGCLPTHHERNKKPVVVKSGHAIKFIEAQSGHYPRLIFERHPDFKTPPGVHIAVSVQFGNEDPDSIVKDDEDPEGWILASDAVLENDEVTGGLRARYRKFQELNIVETSDVTAVDGSLGRIRVLVFYMTQRPESEPEVEHDYNFQVQPPIFEVGEKSIKKGFLSHSLHYGDSQAFLEEPDETDPGVFVDEEERPFAVFDFRYRSRAALETLGVIPTPSRPQKQSEKSRSRESRRRRRHARREKRNKGRRSNDHHRHHHKSPQRQNAWKNLPMWPGSSQPRPPPTRLTRSFPVRTEEGERAPRASRTVVDLTGGDGVDDNDENDEGDNDDGLAGSMVYPGGGNGGDDERGALELGYEKDGLSLQR